MKINWIPREENEIADEISKLIDFDDWQLTDEFFEHLNRKWGPKTRRFNSKFYSPGTEAVDAFSAHLENEINFVVPPVDLIPETLKFILNNPSTGTLVTPLWKSATFLVNDS